MKKHQGDPLFQILLIVPSPSIRHYRRNQILKYLGKVPRKSRLIISKVLNQVTNQRSQGSPGILKTDKANSTLIRPC